MTVLNNAPMHIAQLYNLVALDSTDTFYSTFHVLLVLLSNVTLVVYCVLAHLPLTVASLQKYDQVSDGGRYQRCQHS